MLTSETIEKRPNSGKIVRRSLSKNGSICNSPESRPKEIIKIENPLMSLALKVETKRKISSSRVSNKENTKIAASTDKTMKSSRRSISNKK